MLLMTVVHCPHAMHAPVGMCTALSIARRVAAGVVSREEARAKCPGLVILPMRIERYRTVVATLHATLRAFAPDGAVEKASYDDFYLDVTGAVEHAAAPAADAPAACGQQAVIAAGEQGANVHVAGERGASLASLAEDLQRAAALAARLQARVLAEHSLTVSVGVGRTRLLARLLSPLRRPAGMTLLHDDDIPAFMGAQRIADIPALRGKAGAALTEKLSVSHVRELARFTEEQLVEAAGAKFGAFLVSLVTGGSDGAIEERGPQKSILVERSFLAVATPEALARAARPLADTLWQRLVRALLHTSEARAQDRPVSAHQ
jgi:nucleotidyltransferase/DNA polymerase involved in DNA repair